MLQRLFRGGDRRSSRSEDVRVLRRRSEGLHCSYCRGGIEGVYWLCGGCRAVGHLACLDDSPRCPSIGCRRPVRRELERPVSRKLREDEDTRLTPYQCMAVMIVMSVALCSLIAALFNTAIVQSWLGLFFELNGAKTRDLRGLWMAFVLFNLMLLLFSSLGLYFYERIAQRRVGPVRKLSRLSIRGGRALKDLVESGFEQTPISDGRPPVSLN